MKNTHHIVLILIFILFLFYPMIATLIGISPNRHTVAPSKQEFPVLENINIFKYFSDFDAYYSERFNGRSMYYRSISGLKYNLFGTSAKRESVLVGKDGFLFLGNNESNIINETLGLDLFSNEEVRQIQKRMSEASSWLHKNDIQFYMMVAPNKHTIYPEKLPFKVDANRRTKIDQITRIVSKMKHITWIEMEKNLMRAKKREPIYYKTDTHWNTFGAYFAYRNIMNVLNKDFPGEFGPIPLKKMKRRENERRMLGLPRMLDYPINETCNEVKIPKARSKAKEQAPKLNVQHLRSTKAEVRYKVPKKKRKAVVFRDSFSSALSNFLKEHFEEVVFIWTSTLDKKIILKEKPDIVIYEVVERNVDVMLNM